MAISVQPVDGLIHRLLQQNSKPAPVAARQESVTRPTHDHVSLSSKSPDQEPAASPLESYANLHQKPGEKALESHLLNLYRSNDKIGG